MNLMQVFDCQDMPREVKTSFFDEVQRYSNGGTQNDVYVNWDVSDENGDINGEEPSENQKIVDKWLEMECGLVDLEPEVIINHWW